MKVLRRKDHVLLKNDLGEYHFSFEEYKELGKAKATLKAEAEIAKKLKGGQYQELEIDFKRASDLGFCEYGIEDFCKSLKLDIDKTYTIKHLLATLTLEAFLQYPDECLKLFSNAVFDKFGGVKKLLTDHPTGQVRDLVLRSDLLTDKQKHILGCKFAERVLGLYESEYPDDNRPRNAIETKYKWIEAKF